MESFSRNGLAKLSSIAPMVEPSGAAKVPKANGATCHQKHLRLFSSPRKRSALSAACTRRHQECLADAAVASAAE